MGRRGAVRVRVLIAGRVQGVFFRASAAEYARRLGLAGSVRNLPDGRVEATVEGEPLAVEAMVAWCRTGPDLAVVESVTIEEQTPAGDGAFRIL